MNTVRFYTASKVLEKKLSPLAVRKLIDEKNIMPTDTLDYVSPNNVKVTLVNLRVSYYKKLSQFINDMSQYVEQAVEKKSHIVCFPQYTGLLPLTIFSMYDWIEEVLERACMQMDKKQLGQLGSLYSRGLAGPIFDCYYNTFALLAMRYKIYIQAGSVLIRTKEGLVNRAFLFDTNGEVVLEQDKLFPNQVEQMLGISAGKSVAVGETKMGKLSILIGEDSRYYEACRWAALHGSKLILAPCGGEGYDNIQYYQAALPMRMQECHQYGVQSTMFSNLFPLSGQGIGGVYSPYQLSKTGDGILNSLRDVGALTVRLDIEQLSRLVDIYEGGENEPLNRWMARCYTEGLNKTLESRGQMSSNIQIESVEEI